MYTLHTCKIIYSSIFYTGERALPLASSAKNTLCLENIIKSCVNYCWCGDGLLTGWHEMRWVTLCDQMSFPYGVSSPILKKFQ